MSDQIGEFYAQLKEDEVDQGGDFSERERSARAVIENLQIFAKAFAQGADKTVQRLIVFELDSSLLPKFPASAVPSGDLQAYRIKLSVRLIDVLIQEMESVSTIDDGRYRPEAVILLAAFAAVAHELAHVAYGHLDRPWDSAIKEPNVVRAYESDADRRAGATMIAMYLADSARSIICDFGGVKNSGDFIEASYLAILLISLFFQTGHNKSEHYHSPSTRRRLLQEGFSAGLKDQTEDYRILAPAGVLRAEKLIKQLNIKSSGMLTELLLGDQADWEVYLETTVPLIRGIVRELAGASPFSAVS